MALGDQFLGITSRAERVLWVVNVVSFTENGPSRGPPMMHQLAPHTCFISSHFMEFACKRNMHLTAKEMDQFLTGQGGALPTFQCNEESVTKKYES